ncbi:BON domain-containing protein [Chitinasiproducens palmae]|uniref:BON domain-containing protein n=1 Tax=Chitinasiproducens palmae TaxID=1770053 RepID=A0A1H2PIL0_9BURK|nr:BON domain-containing protein [Chitinasiproducens palmae]SDV46018.1 BON domain-containing protein [Chitinasiproducens palmae]
MNDSLSTDDASITEMLNERLTRRLDLDTDDVTVSVTDGTVRLTGTVPLRRMLHPITQIAEGCPGVAAVENLIDVDTPNATAALGEARGDEPATIEPFEEEPGERQINHEI